MDTKKKEKIVSLIVSSVIIVISLVHIDNWQKVGIYDGSNQITRLIYPFFHVNMLHALLNAWCLLSIVFVYKVSLWRLAIAYIVAVTIPIGIISSALSIPITTPTVGLSGVIYVLFASISFQVSRKWYYQISMLCYLVLGFLFPNTNAWVHLYCYIIGLVIALLNMSIKITK